MHVSIRTLAASVAIAFAGIAFSATATPAAQAAGTDAPAAHRPLTVQQQRMADCNKEAAGKSGAERKAFMSACLKGGHAAAKTTQQERMKTCNADASAKALKGAERKAFMSTCLKGGAPTGK